jgi:hypothetical protein
LAQHNDGTGPALFAGGSFVSAFDSHDSYLAKWGCPDTSAPTITCPDPVYAFDRIGSPPGEVVSFSVSADDGEQDPSPNVESVPPSGSVFPFGTTLVTSTATDASGNQATCQFSVTVLRAARR